MNIIRRGDVYHFVCRKCGCVFRAGGKEEGLVVIDGKEHNKHRIAECPCPDCGESCEGYARKCNDAKKY